MASAHCLLIHENLENYLRVSPAWALCCQPVPSSKSVLQYDRTLAYWVFKLLNTHIATSSQISTFFGGRGVGGSGVGTPRHKENIHDLGHSLTFPYQLSKIFIAFLSHCPTWTRIDCTQTQAAVNYKYSWTLYRSITNQQDTNQWWANFIWLFLATNTYILSILPVTSTWKLWLHILTTDLWS